jgi:primosomal protein N' (replication factor Y)
VLGPVPAPNGAVAGQRPGEAGPDGSGPDRNVRVLVRVGRRDGTALAAALRAAQAARSARKDAGAVRLQLDPAELL